MSRANIESELARLNDSMKQIKKAIFEVSPTNKYVIQLLVQERSHLSREIGIAKERLK